DRSKCGHCSDLAPSYRCLHCFLPQFLCQNCMVKMDEQTPLHRIEIWSGTRLVGISLKILGLRMQLGHRVGDFCPVPIPDNSFIILNAHGIHEVSVDYCGCNDAPTKASQLRAARMLP
ncbi:hypothetical protein B0H10DRAFT_1657134, partial [Mycena sp. CBHHK59/15]